MSILFNKLLITCKSVADPRGGQGGHEPPLKYYLPPPAAPPTAFLNYTLLTLYL